MEFQNVSMPLVEQKAVSYCHLKVLSSKKHYIITKRVGEGVLHFGMHTYFPDVFFVIPLFIFDVHLLKTNLLWLEILSGDNITLHRVINLSLYLIKYMPYLKNVSEKGINLNGIHSFTY
jgi:hypothetical protein